MSYPCFVVPDSYEPPSILKFTIGDIKFDELVKKTKDSYKVFNMDVKATLV